MLSDAEVLIHRYTTRASVEDVSEVQKRCSLVESPLENKVCSLNFCSSKMLPKTPGKIVKLFGGSSDIIAESSSYCQTSKSSSGNTAEHEAYDSNAHNTCNKNSSYALANLIPNGEYQPSDFTNNPETLLPTVEVQMDSQWEKKEVEKEILRLKRENSDLKKNVNIQARVNNEIKNLLIAAVGEDVESKVRVLTEDKLELTEQLIKSSHTLSTHQEQIEWLASECEVWRSKFLSSSLIIEDLAKWKASLLQKLYDIEKASENLFAERRVVRRELLNLYLRFSSGKNEDISNFDTLQLCDELKKISKVFAVPDSTDCVRFDENFRNTKAEDEFQEILFQPVLSNEMTDIVSSAVMMRASVSLSPPAPCCSKCKGQIKMV